MVTEVSAGVIRNSGNQILICRRTGALNGLWEFPGGKREPDETIEECLVRELREELKIDVTVQNQLHTVDIEGNDRTLRLIFMSAAMTENQIPAAIVHSEIRWVDVCDLPNYPFCPADARFLSEFRL